MTLAALVALLALAGENRLWFVDVEVRGACEAVLLDCGAEGTTRIAGPFGAREDRRLSIPVPVRAPPAGAGLGDVPLPRVETLPPGARAEVRLLRWSAEQPSDRLRAAASGLLARARPPASRPVACAGRTELALVLAVGGILLALHARARRLVLGPLALAAGALAFTLAAARRPDAGGTRILEWEAGVEVALAVRSARDGVVGPGDWLEVDPEGGRIELEWDVATGPGWRAAAPGMRLATASSAAVPRLGRARNGEELLERAWTRGPAGEWRSHGPWDVGEPLSVGAPAVEAPPGWLVAGLPPGPTVLLARTAGGTWLRALGFGGD